MGDQVFPLERSWYIGNTMFAILYGIEICMFFMSAHFMCISRRPRRSIYIAYSGTLLVLITIAMASNLFFGQMMWIEHRDVDGGPVAFYVANIAAWYNTLGTAADVMANVLGDGLMLYRCYVFYTGMNQWIVGFPTLLWLASTAMGTTATIQSGFPGGDFFIGTTVNFAIPWLVLTITFNIVTTLMITFRLLAMSRTMRKVLPKERARIYSGVIAILVETALPFTILGIGYIITYIRTAPEALAFANIWGCFVSLSPQAIILRVAMGSAWSKSTVTQYGTKTGTSVEFTNTYRSEDVELSTFHLESPLGSKNGGSHANTSTSTFAVKNTV
ncbi:hypothetical protein GGX14DRAFT_634786 [Mycena pura]|uniref:Uncharacterized protein n=1 Tax=Mycena pura TaxID=153505 RepID=A0AAD6YG14_9AGAR|nr:hypothetical protein GGX14DRAFT_634786 [Mycena pura]